MSVFMPSVLNHVPCNACHELQIVGSPLIMLIVLVDEQRAGNEELQIQVAYSGI